MMLRAHALFLPSTIQYDGHCHTVRAIIDVHPIDAARLSPEGGVTGWPGVPAVASVTVTRTAPGWGPPGYAGTPVTGAVVEAVIVTEEDLLASIGWRAGLNPYMPVGRAEWQTLASHHDARFGLTIEPTPSGATLRFTPPAGVDTQVMWHVVAVAFGPGDSLAGASESYVWFNSDEE